MDGPLTLLYDGACPLCRREMAYLRKLDRGRGRVDGVDISAAGFDPSRYGLTHDEVNGRIYAQRADGTMVSGVEVFRQAYARVGRGWMLKWTAWPGARPVVDAAYRWFAHNRHWLTGRKDCATACAAKS